MHFRSLLFVIAAFLPFAAGAAEPYTEGVHYTRIPQPQPVETAPGKAQVAELFWYGCPHCRELEPHVQAWLKTKPAAVEFVRIPAAFRKNVWHLHAKAFYAAEALGVLDRIHEDMFKAIHDHNQRLASEEELTRFFADHGVPAQDFRDAFNSFAVETKVNRAMELVKRYAITGVPAMVVEGKYLVEGSMAGSYENMIRIAEYLAKREARAKR